jgi:hypothetical protein
VFYGLLSGRSIGLLDGLVIAAVSCALAHQSKDLIEDRFRQNRDGGAWKTFALGASCIAATLLAAGLVRYQARGSQSEENADAFVPAVVDARADVPEVYATGCHANQATTEPKSCSWGPASAELTVVLVGDSHAAQWLPALKKIAADRHWRLTSFTKSACAFTDVDLTIGKDRRSYDSCRQWGDNVMREISRIKPDIVITTQSRGQHAFGAKTRSESDQLIVGGLMRSWRALQAEGIRVVALRDTPRIGVDIPECMGSAKGSQKHCSRPRAKTLATPDPVLMAAAKTPGVGLVDMSDYICGKSVCKPVVRHMLVWRDTHHLTATYARALAPQLEQKIAKVLAAVPRPADAGAH